MPAFNPHETGTPAAAWDGLLGGLPQLPTPGGGARLVVLAAHPDDETLGCGGLLADASRAGADITVLLATDGEASHPHSPTHRPPQLAAIRRAEAAAALHALAPRADVRYLALPDGQLAGHLPQLAAALEEAMPGCTHLVTPWAADGHADHEACGQLGAELAARFHLRHWQYPIWAWHWSDPSRADLPVERLRTVALSAPAQQAKAAALGCYASQHQPLSPQPGDETLLGPHVLAHFARPFETFIATPAADAATPTFFDDLYSAAPDPWGLADRFYEQRKHALVLATLTRPRFRRAFEPGCATGLLTRELAARCDRVVAWDVADAAVAATRRQLSGAEHVQADLGRIPDEWPAGEFDLIVLSEVGYYCRDLALLRRRVQESLSADGVVVACHWRRPAESHVQEAAAVHAELGRELHQVVAHVEPDFLLAAWNRTGTSVAEADGIVPIGSGPA